ncbi:hypothetical protein RRF57_003018 [Xylaria bambusicola]|uniref:Uncharacterized protein n=1 Tax=Xylaria bambusicola TaxID=326684 RepID=A0AAN7UFG1_9PEZI
MTFKASFIPVRLMASAGVLDDDDDDDMTHPKGVGVLGPRYGTFKNLVRICFACCESYELREE